MIFCTFLINIVVLLRYKIKKINSNFSYNLTKLVYKNIINYIYSTIEVIYLNFFFLTGWNTHFLIKE